MKHRIAAGAFVLKDNRILLVRHKKEGSYDFWVAPGGGVIDSEDIFQSAIREVKEESGLDTAPVKQMVLRGILRKLFRGWQRIGTANGRIPYQPGPEV